MIYKYPAIVHNDEDGYWLEFPDLEGCQTFSDTLEGLMSEAKEALACYIEEEIEAGAYLPKPSNVNLIEITENTFVRMIDIELTEKKPVMIDRTAILGV